MVYLIIQAFIVVIVSLFLIVWFHHFGQDFQYPLIRYQRNFSLTAFKLNLESYIGPGVSNYVYYVIIALIIFFGFAIPLIPGSVITLSSFELAIAGILMVALLRFLTLIVSINVFRSLMSAMILAISFAFFISLRNPEALQFAYFTALTNPNTGHVSGFYIALLMGFALFVFVITELSWYGWVTFKNQPIMTSQKFVDSIQSTLEMNSIGYTRKKIGLAYKKVIEDIISNEKLWEICWLSSYGPDPDDDFYSFLIESVAKRLAFDRGHSTGYHKFRLINHSLKEKYQSDAKLFLLNYGMFVMYDKAYDEIQGFFKHFGFEPALIDYVPPVRYLIINQKKIITTFPAHSISSKEGKINDLRSSMYAVSTSPGRIFDFRMQFDSIWGSNQTENIGVSMSNLPNECKLLLTIINERPAVWTRLELLKSYNERTSTIIHLIDLTGYLDSLVESNFIIHINNDTFQRSLNRYRWQNRWLHKPV